MCGHVGVAGNLGNKEVKMFNDMLIADSVRGMHSTGVASVGLGDNVEVIKELGPAPYLMELKRYDSVVSQTKMVLIGHNRHATMGGVTRANAHPFVFPNVVGAHNGTIPHSDKKAIPNHEKFGTDSEAIFAAFNDAHPEDLIKNLYGAWALVWFDRKERTINFLRNDQRDLCFALSKDNKCLFWASEPYMLRWAAQRNSVELMEDKVWRLSPNRWRSWKIPTSWNTELPEALESTLEGLKESSTPVSQAWSGGYHGGVYDTPFNWKAEQSRREEKEKARKEAEEARKASQKDGTNVIPLPDRSGDVDDDVYWAEVIMTGKHKNVPYLKCTRHGNSNMGPKQYREQTGEACCNCDNTIPWADVVQGTQKVHFINQNQFMCEECISEPWMRDFYDRLSTMGV